jgi:hypothetical protein
VLAHPTLSHSFGGMIEKMARLKQMIKIIITNTHIIVKVFASISEKSEISGSFEIKYFI